MNRTTAMLGVLVVAALCLPTASAADVRVITPHPCEEDPHHPEADYCLVSGVVRATAQLADDVIGGNVTSLQDAQREVDQWKAQVNQCIQDWLTLQPEECPYDV